ncbi:MAG: glycoside hydrolase family 2 TIM barrel-domain containing protein [Huintestinicola sp.]
MENNLKKHFIYHEDPHSLHIGTETPHNYFIPFNAKDKLDASDDSPAALKKSSCRSSLDGAWRFAYYDSISDAEDDFISVLKQTKKTIPVPSCMNLQGFGQNMYLNTRYPITYDPPYVPDDNPAGIYQREIIIKKREGQRYLLNFEGVDSCLYLFVNDSFVGYSQVSHMTSEFDITDYAVNGENTITVVVLKYCDGTYLECQDKFRMSGIFRSVYLLTRPEKRIRDYTLSAELNDDYSEAKIKISAESDVPVSFEVYREGELIGEGTPRKAVIISSPKLWNAEAPCLYTVIIRAGDEVICEKLGIRKIYTENGVLMLNGTPIKIRGVNRHDSDPYVGYAVNYEHMLRDLTLMKQHNINAVRCSHYPNAPEFLKLCDRMGFYVIDEADLEAHGSADAGADMEQYDYSNIALLVNEPEFEEAILDRIMGMAVRDRNRCSVIIWSLGNESGYSKAMEKAAKALKKYDRSRLVHYESLYRLPKGKKAKDDILDFVSQMYHSPADIKRGFLDNKDETRPFILCEYCHAMGNGPGDLKDYWDLIYSEERLCGGLVWEWCDHSIAVSDKNDKKDAKHFTYGGDFGEPLHDGNFCVDGLVYPDRTLHTGLLELKNAYCPISVTMDSKTMELTFINRLAFTNAWEYINCSFKAELNGSEIASGPVFLDGLKANSRISMTMPFIGMTELTEYDSFYITFFFTLKKPCEWADKGHSLGFAEICIQQGKIKTEDITPDKSISLEETEKNYIIRSGSCTYSINKKTAELERLTSDGFDYLEKPASINIFRAPTDNDVNVKQGWYRFHYNNPVKKLYSITAAEADGIVTVSAHYSLGWFGQKKLLAMRQDIIIGGNGHIRMISEAEMTKENRPYLPRIGMRFFLPKGFEQAEYFGYGGGESYIDKHLASRKAIFSQTVEEQYEPYIRPQEHGSHWCCDYVKLSSKEHSLRVVSDIPFSANFSHYTQEELERTTHRHLLNKSQGVVLCTDYAHSGVGSNSCGPELAEKYRVKFDKITMVFDVFAE